MADIEIVNEETCPVCEQGSLLEDHAIFAHRVEFTEDGWAGVLFFGDNGDVLRRHVAPNCVDLVYLDPPFNSNRAYNMLFKHSDGERPAAAQEWAFDDMWRWDAESVRTFDEIVAAGGPPSDMIRGLRAILGPSDMLAYVTMMTPRLLELQRVLKPTGSLYLHCDPNVSHYLKLILDAIFGPENFRNEIVWKRFNFHADAKRFGRISDRLLFYSASDEFTFNGLRVPFSDEYVRSKFRHEDPDGRRYRLDNLNPPGGRGPTYEFNGVTKPWRVTEEKMRQLDSEGRIYKKSKMAQLKRYLDELEGQAVHELWTDIAPVNPRAAERLGYPTQKPVALLERLNRGVEQRR